jgi:hypothetical protein
MKMKTVINIKTGISIPLFGQGSTLSALSTQAVPASLLAGTACQNKPDEAQPRPNHSDFFTAMALENICVSVELKKYLVVLKKNSYLCSDDFLM